MDAIAQKLGVSRRTVERWATEDEEGKWTDLKTARKVVGISEARAAREDVAPRPKRSQKAEDFKPLQLVDLALNDVSGMMAGRECMGDDGPITMISGRDMAGLASALCKLIELRLKLAPPTAEALAERAIALGYSPQEFAAELRRQWQQQA